MKKEHEDILKDISNLALHTSLNLDNIVTPRIYTKLFCELCSEKGVDTSKIDKNIDIENTIEKSIYKMNKLYKDTKDGFLLLKDTTSEAKIAIEQKDEEAIENLQGKVEKLEDKLSKLEQELYNDALTKVYNRKWLMDKNLDKDESFSKDGFLAVIDLDNFKIINDTYGHIIGDKTLSFVANNLKKLQNSQTVRYAGDEFFLIGDLADLKTVHKELAKLRDEITKQTLYSKGNKFHISFSYGIDKYKKGDSFKEAVATVDKLMYLDKKQRKKERERKS